MTMVDALDRGRESFARRAWSEAFAQLTLADGRTPLAAADLDLLVTAAYLVGRDEVADGLSARAYREYHRRDPARAARRAFWLGLQLRLRGEEARGAGWLARVRHLLDDAGLDGAERGYPLVIDGLTSLDHGDADGAHRHFAECLRLGERFGDADLATLGHLGVGRSLILGEQIAEGLASLDEAMVAVTADEVSPMVAGLVYCAVLDECQRVFDLRRAREWTVALTRWCAAQPDLVPYRGQCLVHRAEIMRLHGAWPDAMTEARRAAELLSRPPVHAAVGAAYYQQAELHRVAGTFEQSEQAYRQADRWGRDAQPGLALLRLAQGRAEAAAAAIRRAVELAAERVHRAGLLAAHVEIMLAVGDRSAARAAADELDKLADHFATPLSRAVAAWARGAVLLADGDGRAAYDVLRGAWAAWRELDAPYDAARVRVLMALACRQLGDEESVELELDAACWVFRQLGAGPALQQADGLSRPRPGPAPASPLTVREVEVLRLVAEGRTNRAIAGELVISEKTVARYVSNIFGKLGVSSRSAATAYAYRHGLA